MYLLAICTSSFEKCLVSSFAHLKHLLAYFQVLWIWPLTGVLFPSIVFCTMCVYSAVSFVCTELLV